MTWFDTFTSQAPVKVYKIKYYGPTVVGYSLGEFYLTFKNDVSWYHDSLTLTIAVKVYCGYLTAFTLYVTIWLWLLAE